MRIMSTPDTWGLERGRIDTRCIVHAALFTCSLPVQSTFKSNGTTRAISRWIKRFMALTFSADESAAHGLVKSFWALAEEIAIDALMVCLLITFDVCTSMRVTLAYTNGAMYPRPASPVSPRRVPVAPST